MGEDSGRGGSWRDSTKAVVSPRNEGLEFHVLRGDANGDRKVDFSDLVILAQNYGLTGRTSSQGNFDYSSDGLVDFADLVILAQKYNVSFPPPAPISGTMARASALVNDAGPVKNRR